MITSKVTISEKESKPPLSTVCFADVPVGTYFWGKISLTDAEGLDGLFLKTKENIILIQDVKYSIPFNMNNINKKIYYYEPVNIDLTYSKINS